MSLEEIREREAAATKGPWEARGLAYNTTVGTVGEYKNLARLGDPLDREAWRNAEFIAAARTDIPRLLAAVDAALALHHKVDDLSGDDRWYAYCDLDGRTWPCATVRAITDALVDPK